ncbi:endopeptidase La [Meiothermus granaticius]|uniref:Lon protease n=1 Tax=Meiothermus granaticius NBRC 107808 TaxID=1227551 RepID=A0A399F8A5_9DEIN|nr:endopeptidase La [Meiothermus granaticius]MCL6526842.1 endopeptidase La [Thermaceae bacterium]RIH92468.1 Lon protease 1 [Meiothermus granaticius NBRC 107808]GEM87166.1 Lon protease [Meiothermus granaticius NBRC 107808]
MSDSKIDTPVNTHLPETLPVCPVRGSVIYPSMVMPIDAGRPVSIRAIDAALAQERVILIVSQRDKDVEEPSGSDLYEVGTACNILRMRKNADGSVQMLVQAFARARVETFTQEDGYLSAKVTRIEEEEGRATELKALFREVKERFERLLKEGKYLTPEVAQFILNLEDPSQLADYITFHLDFKLEDKQRVLETASAIERLKRVAILLDAELDLLETQRRIQQQVKDEVDKNQREFYLREQMKAIQRELGGEEGEMEVEEFREKIAALQLPENVRPEVERELNRFARMHPDSAEASVVRTYLDWIVSLPWNIRTEDQIDLKQAKAILDEDHYGLEKVKDRVLEYLAVRKLKLERAKKGEVAAEEVAKGPILLFVGPPGVGKTSIAKAIAKSLGRKYHRISLGGARDESDIRGHRRTYIGALPGRVIQGLRQAGSKNPVFLLDEVDKLGAGYQGDPAAALLELLDPAQNKEFTDHYLGVPFDMSEVLFICTANFPENIPGPLMDRMELIEFTSYIEQEKLEIAKRYLLPRQLSENGLKENQVVVTEAALNRLITHYTREAGVRNLEREIGTLLRKAARVILEEGKKRVRITDGDLEKYLGPARHMPESEAREPQIGVATGMFYTPVGGDIMFIETSVMPGKGQLILTGQLGEVMKESARAALSYAKKNAARLGIPLEKFDNSDVHIHVPAGAVPKEGPSAGIALTASLVSALAEVPVRNDVSMTGEITLTGRVLPIGGVKEKVLGARRAGIREVILPKQNEPDLSDIPAYLRHNLRFHFAENLDQALDWALVGGAQHMTHKPAQPVRKPRRPKVQPAARA